MLLYALMIIGGAVMVYALLKYKQGYPWGKPVAVVAALFTLVLAFGNIFSTGGPDAQKMSERNQRYQEVAAEKLGAHLAAEYPDAKTVILSHMDYSKIQSGNETEPPAAIAKIKAQEEALLKGADEGLDVVKIIHPEIPEETLERMQPPESEGAEEEMIDPMIMEEMGTMMEAADYNEMLDDELDDCELFVMLTDPPYEVEKLKLWRMDNPPKTAFLSPSVLDKLEKAVKQGFVVAIVSHNPDADYSMEDSVPKKLDEAFDERYILITPDNLDELSSKHENLFSR
ncbi:MAG: hypothetical protein ACOCQP_00980 [Lentisphaeria bacterium]